MFSPGPGRLAAGESPPRLDGHSSASQPSPETNRPGIIAGPRLAKVLACMPTQLNPLASLSISSLLLRLRWR